MNDAISKTFFLKFEPSNCKKSRSFNKDLFTQKLGQTLKFNSSLRKNRLPSKMLVNLCVGIDKKLLSQKENKEEIEQANDTGLNR